MIYKTWEVAAAVLYFHQTCHYDELAGIVRRTGLCKLDSPNDTNHNTIHSRMSEREDVFDQLGGGEFSLNRHFDISNKLDARRILLEDLFPVYRKEYDDLLVSLCKPMPEFSHPVLASQNFWLADRRKDKARCNFLHETFQRLIALFESDVNGA